MSKPSKNLKAINEAEELPASKATETESAARVYESRVRSRTTASPDGTVTVELKTKAIDMKKAIKAIKRPTRSYLDQIFDWF